MNSIKPQLPKINDEDRTPLVDVLLELLVWQEKQIDELKQEILKLKGETTKPKIQPSTMDKDSTENGAGNGEDSGASKKHKGPKRSKTELPVGNEKLRKKFRIVLLYVVNILINEYATTL